MIGGGSEAVATAPAAGTGIGVVIPAAGVVTAVVSAGAVVHGVVVGVNTLGNIYSGKGKDGHPAKGDTTQDKVDQYSDITTNQANKRKVGRGTDINSTEKSKQNIDKSLKDITKIKNPLDWLNDTNQ